MILVLNFKTYLKKEKDYLKIIKDIKNIKKVDFWLALNPYFYLNLILKLKKDFKNFKIGLQNIGPISQKPQTGEIIYDFQFINLAHFVLIGHSERYRLGENIDIIKNKIANLQEKKLKLLIFFSENSYKPPQNFLQIKKATQNNLEKFLSIIKEENYKKIYFVYEPWWAISTEGGKIPSKEFLENFLDWYKEFLNIKIKTYIPIFYGGSYNSTLTKIYQGLSFNGYVLGRASISAKELKNIVKNI